MASRSQSTFKKRQKETERVEKQREKMAKRIERKNAEPTPERPITLEEAALLRS